MERMKTQQVNLNQLSNLKTVNTFRKCSINSILPLQEATQTNSKNNLANIPQILQNFSPTRGNSSQCQCLRPNFSNLSNIQQEIYNFDTIQVQHQSKLHQSSDQYEESISDFQCIDKHLQFRILINSLKQSIEIQLEAAEILENDMEIIERSIEKLSRNNQRIACKVQKFFQ